MLTAVTNDVINMEHSNEEAKIKKYTKKQRCFSFYCTGDKWGTRTKGLVVVAKDDICPDCGDYVVWSYNEK